MKKFDENFDEFKDKKLNTEAWKFVAHHINNHNCIIAGIAELIGKKHPHLKAEAELIKECIDRSTKAIRELEKAARDE
jgi:hypothetical protein